MCPSRCGVQRQSHSKNGGGSAVMNFEKCWVKLSHIRFLIADLVRDSTTGACPRWAEQKYFFVGHLIAFSRADFCDTQPGCTSRQPFFWFDYRIGSIHMANSEVLSEKACLPLAFASEILSWEPVLDFKAWDVQLGMCNHVCLGMGTYVWVCVCGFNLEHTAYIFPYLLFCCYMFIKSLQICEHGKLRHLTYHPRVILL